MFGSTPPANYFGPPIPKLNKVIYLLELGYGSIQISLYVCLYVCMLIFEYVCLYVCLSVCMYVCLRFLSLVCTYLAPLSQLTASSAGMPANAVACQRESATMALQRRSSAGTASALSAMAWSLLASANTVAIWAFTSVDLG
jgi:hypothetical protein